VHGEEMVQIGFELNPGGFRHDRVIPKGKAGRLGGEGAGNHPEERNQSRDFHEYPSFVA
jgi:hypothetical protein